MKFIISTSLLFTIFGRHITLVYGKTLSMIQIDEWCKHIHSCICARGQ